MEAIAAVAGATLGRYRLLERVSSGSTGTVWIAVDTALRIRLCLKVLRPALARDATMLERFRRELVLARRVVHRGVCRVFDLHEERGTWFLTMEHVEGAPLSTLVRAPLTPARAMQIGAGICRPLAVAHDAGILHRDIKPANVMIGRGDRVTLLDFGFATCEGLARLTGPGKVVGTRDYLAPELLCGGEHTPQSDLYAVGVLLYGCLTGRRARADVPPSAYAPAIPPALDDVMLRAVAPDPRARWQSARALEAALHAVEDPTDTVPYDDDPTLPLETGADRAAPAFQAASTVIVRRRARRRWPRVVAALVVGTLLAVAEGWLDPPPVAGAALELLAR